MVQFFVGVAAILSWFLLLAAGTLAMRLLR
jgi:hypothetical protein